MPIRIHQIRVNRGGPLARDFELSPARLNLIYGPNETGKTYLVEAILRLLFTQGRKAGFDWKLRGWDPSGRVLVSGIGPEPVAFEKGGQKLDQILRDSRGGLPPGLSQLLVVKAGDPMLDPRTPAGISQDFLKNHLSGEGLIDTIEGRISATLSNARVVDGVIEGHARGEIKNRTELLDQRKRVDDLLEKIDRSEALGVVESLTTERDELESRLKELEKARRFRAHVLLVTIQQLDLEIARLPGDAEIQALQEKLSRHSSNSGSREQKQRELADLEKGVEDCVWAENALKVYGSILGAVPKERFARTSLWVTAALAVLTLILGLYGYLLPFLISGLASLVLGAFFVRAQGKALRMAGKSSELERLRAEFKKRFGEELTDQAVLQTKVDTLKEERVKARVLEDDIRSLAYDLAGLAREIQASFEAMGADAGLGPPDWRGAHATIRGTVTERKEQLQPLERELAALSVSEADALETDPGLAWDSSLHGEVGGKLAELGKEIQEAEESLANLRSRVQQETGSTLTSWSGLVNALHERRDKVQAEYRRLTAEILAKIALNDSLNHFRAQESERIREGLRREEIRTALSAVGGHYVGLGRDEEDRLTAVSRKNDQIPLGDLSSGALEQVFFALRVGFASMALGGEPAFLILDDAFQHSDWCRRKTLVRATQDLTDQGWQVFYFTMDDHLRELFSSVGRGDEERVCRYDLTG